MVQRGATTKKIILGILIIVGIAIPFFSGKFYHPFLYQCLDVCGSGQLLEYHWRIYRICLLRKCRFSWNWGLRICRTHGKGWDSFLISFPASGLGAAIFAILIGLPVLRLKGHYFALQPLVLRRR